MRRLFLWIVGSVVGLVLLTVIGLGIYTNTAHFRTWARSQLLAAVQPAINGEVNLDRISGSLWSGLTLHNLVIRQNGTEVIRVPLLSVSLDLAAQGIAYLRSSSLRVDTIVLQDPVVILTQNPQAEWNLAQLMHSSASAAPTQPSPLSLFVDQVRITNGRLDITPTGDTTSQVTALAVAGAMEVQPTRTRVDLTTLSFTLARHKVPPLHWQGGLTYDTSDPAAQLSLKNVDLRTAHSHVQLSGTVQNLTDPVVAATARAEHLALADLRTLSPTIPLQQDLTGTITAQGPLSDMQIAATVSAPDGVVKTWVTANLTQTPVQYRGKLEVSQLNIPKVVQVEIQRGIVTGQSTFVGSGSTIAQGTVEVMVSDLQVGQYAVGTVTTSGRLQNQHIQLTGKAEGALGAVDWQGQVGVGQPLSYDLTLNARNLELTQVIAQPSSWPVTLSVTGRVHGSGTEWENLNSALVATVLPSRIGEVTGIQGQIEGSVREGQLTISTLSLHTHDASVTAQGQVAGLQQSDAGTLTYAVQSKNITSWLALVGQSGSGAVTLEGKATGTRTNLEVSGTATVRNLQVADSTLQSGSLTYRGTGIGGTQPQGQATAVVQEMNAGIPWRTARMHLALNGMQPLILQIDFTGQDAARRRHRAKTQLQYTAGRIESVVQEMETQLPTGIWRLPQPARVLLQEQTLRVERLQLQRGSHGLTINGTLAARGPQDLQVQITRLSLAEVRTLVGSGPPVEGDLSATLRVHGTAEQPLLNAEVTTSALQVAGQTYGGLAAQATYQAPRLQLSARLRQDTVHALAVEGGIPLALSWVDAQVRTVLGEVDLRVSSQGLSLAFLNHWSKDVQNVQGIIQAEARVRGPLAAPVLSGSAQLQDGKARIPKLGVSLAEINTKAVFTSTAVQLSALQVRSGRGRLTGSGTIGLAGDADTNLDLTLRAERFQVVQTDQYQAALSGRLLASGSLQQPVIQGALTVEETTLRPAIEFLQSKPVPPDPTITVVRSPQDPRSRATGDSPPGAASGTTANGADTPSVLDQLTLDITLQIPRDTWVNVADGAVEFYGDVRIRKAIAEEMTLVGVIESVRGWYKYQGRKFRLERGSIQFTGATPINPGLDVLARYTVRNYQVEIIIAGTARAPKLALRSEPALEQADILSLLMFGKTTTSLSAGEKVSLQSQVLQTATGYIANDLRQSLAKELGVDNLEFDVGETLKKSRIGAGKYVAEDVFVSTSQEVGNPSAQEFTVEYSFSENWQIKASTTTRGNDGIDVLWQKRY